MNTPIKESKLDRKQALRNAAVLAVTGATGNEFWKEVQDRVNAEAETKVEARNTRENR